VRQLFGEVATCRLPPHPGFHLHFSFFQFCFLFSLFLNFRFSFYQVNVQLGGLILLSDLALRFPALTGGFFILITGPPPSPPPPPPPPPFPFRSMFTLTPPSQPTGQKFARSLNPVFFLLFLLCGFSALFLSLHLYLLPSTWGER